MDRRVGRAGERQRPRGGHRLDVRRSRASRGSAVRCRHAASAAATAGVEQDRVLAVDLEHRRRRAPSTRIASNSALVGSRKSKTMNAFEVATPAVDRRRQLGERIVGAAADREAQAVVDRAVARRSRRATRGRPVTSDRSAAGRRAGPGVVERQERRRAAERRRDRILEEPVGLGVAWRRACGCGRRRRRAGRAARSRRRPRPRPAARPRQVGLDRRDPAAVDRDVGRPRARRGDHRPAADDEVGHGRRPAGRAGIGSRPDSDERSLATMASRR